MFRTIPGSLETNWTGCADLFDEFERVRNKRVGLFISCGCCRVAGWLKIRRLSVAMHGERPQEGTGYNYSPLQTNR